MTVEPMQAELGCSLSEDVERDPPVRRQLAAGHVTIPAGPRSITVSRRAPRRVAAARPAARAGPANEK